MSDAANPSNASIPVEGVLRDELAHGDAVLGTVAPILGHLVTNSGNALFSDQVVAHIRGTAESMAAQLLGAQATAAQIEDPLAFVSHRKPDLAADLLADNSFLSHCHALTVEAQLATRLEQRNAIDLVLSPLLQALISSDDPETASLAMAALAAQARFVQQQKRMELSINDLPGDLFHSVLLIWRNFAATDPDQIVAQAEMQLRSVYDESASRVGLLSRLVSGMGNGALAALSLSHAGVAIFLTALAKSSGQSRDIATMSTNDRQLGRLALALRAAGLKPRQVEEQFVHIHPEVALPEGFEMLRIDKAAEILAESAGRMAG